ncbi:MAG: metabolite traffic protein EboE [Leptospiraceae bacterium]
MISRIEKSELTYCSNVHPGESAESVIQNLRRYVGQTRQDRGLDVMSAGIWISDRAARELQDPGLRKKYIETLKKENLWPVSINGFPFGGFHDSRVKETVYEPDWSESDRLEYSMMLVNLAAEALQEAPAGFRHCAISTVPLGFKASWSFEKEQDALANLIKIQNRLEQVNKDSGVDISICLEMEPGCALEATDELIQFWDRLRDFAASNDNRSNQNSDKEHRNANSISHLGVCYDVCHQAVMFEDIGFSLRSLHRAGIPVFKIQISSAIEVRWPGAKSAEDPAAKEQLIIDRLSPFCDERYLHQTSVYSGSLESQTPAANEGQSRSVSGSLQRFLDLPMALNEKESRSGPGGGFKDRETWRIHYHVPIHLNDLEQSDTSDGYLFTTRKQIEEALDFLMESQARPILEIETYTWTVLPPGIRNRYENVIEAIQLEFQYLEKELERRKLLE